MVGYWFRGEGEEEIGCWREMGGVDVRPKRPSLNSQTSDSVSSDSAYYKSNSWKTLFPGKRCTIPIGIGGVGGYLSTVGFVKE